MSGSLTFIEPTEEHAQLLLDWRTRPDIAGQMLSAVAYDVERQKAWLRRCAERDDYVHRILCVDGVPAGHISITITEPEWRIATFGVLKRQVVKDGQEIDLHIFEMLAEDWLAVRDRFGVYRDMDGREWR